MEQENILHSPSVYTDHDKVHFAYTMRNVEVVWNFTAKELSLVFEVWFSKNRTSITLNQKEEFWKYILKFNFYN